MTGNVGTAGCIRKQLYCIRRLLFETDSILCWTDVWRNRLCIFPSWKNIFLLKYCREVVELLFGQEKKTAFAKRKWCFSNEKGRRIHKELNFKSFQKYQFEWNLYVEPESFAAKGIPPFKSCLCRKTKLPECFCSVSRLGRIILVYGKEHVCRMPRSLLVQG